jgi:hypothetical protein
VIVDGKTETLIAGPPPASETVAIMTLKTLASAAPRSRPWRVSFLFPNGQWLANGGAFILISFCT